MTSARPTSKRAQTQVRQAGLISDGDGRRSVHSCRGRLETFHARVYMGGSQISIVLHLEVRIEKLPHMLKILRSSLCAVFTPSWLASHRERHIGWNIFSTMTGATFNLGCMHPFDDLQAVASADDVCATCACFEGVLSYIVQALRLSPVPAVHPPSNLPNKVFDEHGRPQNHYDEHGRRVGNETVIFSLWSTPRTNMHILLPQSTYRAHHVKANARCIVVVNGVWCTQPAALEIAYHVQISSVLKSA